MNNTFKLNDTEDENWRNFLLLSNANSDYDLKNINFAVLSNLSCFRICEISLISNEEAPDVIADYIKSYFISLHNVSTYVAFILIKSNDKYSLSICFDKSLKNSAKSLFKGLFSSSKLIDNNLDLQLKSYNYIGLLTGIPSYKNEDEYTYSKITRSSYLEDWVYIITLRSIPVNHSSIYFKKVLDIRKKVASQKELTITGGANNSLSYNISQFSTQKYDQILEIYSERMQDAMISGLWAVHSYILSNDEDVCKMTGNSIAAASTVHSKPFCYKYIHLGNVDLPNDLFIPIKIRSDESHPMSSKFLDDRSCNWYDFEFCNILTNDEVGKLCALPTKEIPGLSVKKSCRYDYNPISSVKDTLTIGNIIRNDTELSSKYSIGINDLNRHGLIVGMTGSGKSNTCRNMLKQLWIDKSIPFLVMESAKKEYWRIYQYFNSNDFRIFTLGLSGSNSMPLNINPFFFPEGIALQTHIDYLLSTFSAAFVLYPPMPYVLELAVYEVYDDYGWDVTDNLNLRNIKTYPTLTDLYYKVDKIVDRLGYTDRISGDIKASLKARIHSLRVGGKGSMLDVEQSYPARELLAKPTILEMDDVGDNDIKAFILGIVLIYVYEYYKSLNLIESPLRHVMLIEEAHNLLSNTNISGNDQANTKQKAVEFFSNMLAEIRSYGEGLLIADQIPTKLASEVMKNTNLKISHRIVERSERETIGGAMNMLDDQIEYLTILNRGEAAIHSEGDFRPKHIKVPYLELSLDGKREQVLNNTRDNLKKFDLLYKFPCGCLFGLCKYQCRYGGINSDIWEECKPQYNYSYIDNEIKKKLIEIKNDYMNKDYEPQMDCLISIIINGMKISNRRKKESFYEFMNIHKRGS